MDSIQDGAASNEAQQEREREDYIPRFTPSSSVTAPLVSLFSSDCNGAAPKSRPAAASMARRARKGFGMTGARKKRLMLRIEGEAARRVQEPSSQSQEQETQVQSGSAGDDVAWWKVEYQQPPPGHLGAHILPVAEATIEGARLTVVKKVDELTPTASDVSPGTRKRELTTHETPERANRRARADDMSAFPSIPSCRSSCRCVLVV